MQLAREITILLRWVLESNDVSINCNKDDKEWLRQGNDKFSMIVFQID